MKRLRELSTTQQRAGMMAGALALCMLLPWYRASFPDRGGVVAHDNLTAFGAFSWVEAAVLLVAGSVLYLMWARAHERGFHLPGGDGMAVTIAGGWTLFLLIWRLFDRPGVAKGTVGVQWGLFATMVVAAALIAAGQRMRIEHRPEPPNPAEDPTWEMPGSSSREERRARRPVDARALTRTLREDKPSWEGEPPEPPRRARPVEPKDPPDEGKLF